MNLALGFVKFEVNWERKLWKTLPPIDIILLLIVYLRVLSSFSTISAAIFIELILKTTVIPKVGRHEKGVLSVAVLALEEVDVSPIDVASIRLEGVAPIRSSYEDVATVVNDDAEVCECTTEGPDGYLDLTLKFKVQDIVAALGEVNDGDLLELSLTGALAKVFDGIPIVRIGLCGHYQER